MSPNLSTLWVELSQNWYLVLLFLGTLVYGKFGPVPASRGLWCPNIVSLIATITCLIGYYVFIVDMQLIAIGILIYTAGGILDAVDGRIGRKHDGVHGKKDFTSFKEAFLHRGTSDYGAIWDSSHDKLRVVLIYSHVSWMAFSTGHIIVGVLFTVVTLTDLISGIRKISTFRSHLKTGVNHSQEVGKVKAWAQQLVLLPWVFLPLAGEVVLISMLGITLSLTVGSIVVRLVTEHYKRRKGTGYNAQDLV